MDDYNFTITKKRKELEKIITQTLELAKLKTNNAEVIIKKTIGINIKSRYNSVENIEFHDDEALIITVYNNLCKGSASTTNFSIDSIKRTVQAAVDIAHYTSHDQFAGLPDSNLLAYESLDLDLYHPWKINFDDAIKLTLQAEETSLNFDKRIINTEGSTFSSHASIKAIGNSYGMLQSYLSTCHSLYVCIVAKEKEKMERDYAYTISRDFKDLKNPDFIGTECARRVLSRLSSRKLSTMKAPVIFSSEIASSLLYHLVDAINGNNVYYKSTILANSLNKKILPEWITINERPHLLKGLASKPFDNEGVCTKNLNIIKNGILQTWLMNSYSARKLGLISNAHSGGIYNWFVNKQKYNFNDLLKYMNTGLVVTELMGDGVNIITGDYSRGVSGFWVENGNIQYAVSEITISGNLKDMWRNIIAIGNDIEYRNAIQCGSILISEMQIAGK